MGFVGGGGNIAIVSAQPLLNFVLHCVEISISLGFLYIVFFMLAWNFGLRMWKLTWAHGVLFLGPAEYSTVYSNVRGLSKNLSDVTVSSSQYDLLLCSETLVSDRRHHGGMINRWPHQKTSTLDDVIARNCA